MSRRTDQTQLDELSTNPESPLFKAEVNKLAQIECDGEELYLREQRLIANMMLKVTKDEKELEESQKQAEEQEKQIQNLASARQQELAEKKALHHVQAENAQTVQKIHELSDELSRLQKLLALTDLSPIREKITQEWTAYQTQKADSLIEKFKQEPLLTIDGKEIDFKNPEVQNQFREQTKVASPVDILAKNPDLVNNIKDGKDAEQKAKVMKIQTADLGEQFKLLTFVIKQGQPEDKQDRNLKPSEIRAAQIKNKNILQKGAEMNPAGQSVEKLFMRAVEVSSHKVLESRVNYVKTAIKENQMKLDHPQPKGRLG